MAAEAPVLHGAWTALGADRGRVTRVSPAEWRWVCWTAAIVMAVTVIPYTLAADGLAHGQVFGALPLSVEDGFSYLAKMQQGARGAWSFTLPFSSEPHDGVFLFLFYLVLGKLSGTDHLAQLIVFHGARVVFGFASLLAFYRLASEFVPQVTLRRLAFFAYGLAGGLGWLSLGFMPANGTLAVLPLELYSPETFAVISLIGWPHLLASRALVIGALIGLFTGRFGRSGLALLATALIVPLSVIPVWGVAVTFLLTQALSDRATNGLGRAPAHAPRSVGQPGLRSVGQSLKAWPIFVLPAPVVAYGVWALQGHPVMAAMHAQLLLPSPSLLYYGLAYLPWWALAWVGLGAVARRRPALAWAAAVWAGLGLALVYFPTNTQRRLIEGYWPLLVPMAVAGLPAIARRLRAWNTVARRWLVPGLAAWTLPGTLLVVGSALFAVLVPTAPTYTPVAQAEVFARVADERGVALGEWTTVAWAPAFTGLTGYAGHRVETLDPDRKAADIARFYATDASDAERIALLRSQRITIVFHGPLERALGAFDPAAVDYLTPIGKPVDGYAVYRVVLPGESNRPPGKGGPSFLHRSHSHTGQRTAR